MGGIKPLIWIAYPIICLFPRDGGYRSSPYPGTNAFARIGEYRRHRLIVSRTSAVRPSLAASQDSNWRH